jgi:hypothetical protein
VASRPVCGRCRPGRIVVGRSFLKGLLGQAGSTRVGHWDLLFKRRGWKSGSTYVGARRLIATPRPDAQDHRYGGVMDGVAQPTARGDENAVEYNSCEND